MIVGTTEPRATFTLKVLAILALSLALLLACATSRLEVSAQGNGFERSGVFREKNPFYFRAREEKA